MGPLIILNIIAWGYIFYSSRNKEAVHLPEPVFSDFVKCPRKLCEVPATEFYFGMTCRGCSLSNDDHWEELQIQQEFKSILDRSRDELEILEFLDTHEIYHSQEGTVIWADGTPLEVGNEDDLLHFLRVIRPKALAERIYNSKELYDGGWEDLDVTHLRLKGYSVYGARQFLKLGLRPDDAMSLIL